MTGVGASERDLYSRIYANSQDSVFLLDVKTRLPFLTNPRAQEDTSFESEELAKLPFESLFLEEDREALLTLLQSTLEWGQGTDPKRTLRRKSGKKIWVEIATLAVDFEGAKAIFANIRDISERVRHEEELEGLVAERTADLAAAMANLSIQKRAVDDVMESIREGIVTISPNLTLNEEHSKFALEIFGDRFAEGVAIDRFLFSEEQTATQGPPLLEWLGYNFEDPSNWELTRGFGLKQLSFAKHGPDGSTDLRDIELSWYPIIVDEKMTKMMLVCNDITEKKLLEAEIEKKKEEHREELELIAQLVTLSPGVVEQFISDFQQYLSEARAILASDGEWCTKENLNAFLRHLHSIKGSSRILKLGSIEGRTHRLEERIVEIERKKLDSIQASEFFPEIDSSFSVLESALESILNIYNRIMKGLSGPTSTGSDHSNQLLIARKIEGLLETTFSGQGPHTTQSVRRALAWLFLVPVRIVFDRLQQLAESLSVELRRDIGFDVMGERTRIDWRTVPAIYEALMHAVRNSIDHAYETEEERVANGKSPRMQITLSAEELGGDQVLVQISDDGKGIDPAVLKKKAIEKGLISEENAAKLSRPQSLALIFLPGFSTKEEVTEISGRGIGMDVLKELVEKKLGGEVEIQSVLGQFSRLTLRFNRDYLSKTSLPFKLLIDDSERAKKIGDSLGLETNPAMADSPNAGLLIDTPRLESVFAELEANLHHHVICAGGVSAIESAQLLQKHSALDHYIAVDHPQAASYLRSVLKKMSRKTASGIESYLWPSTHVTSRRLKKYLDKEEVIAGMVEGLKGLETFSALPDLCATIADEMIMNAMFDAPRGSDGKPKYNHLPRTEPLELADHETVTFRYGWDPAFVALSIEDPFGALTKETLIRHINKGFGQGADQINQSAPGGAGLGFFMIFENTHSLIVNCTPGKSTEVIALIAISKNFRQFQEAGKSFSYFRNRAV